MKSINRNYLLKVLLVMTVMVNTLNIIFVSATDNGEVVEQLDVIEAVTEIKVETRTVPGLLMDTKLVSKLLSYTTLREETFTSNQYQGWCNSVPTTAEELTIEKLGDFRGVLNCTNLGITDSYGIEYLTGASHFELQTNNISSIGSMSGRVYPFLERLYLSTNDLTNLDFLYGASMPSLYIVDISLNNITNIDGLASLSLDRLYTLNATNNQIVNMDSFLNKSYPILQQIQMDTNQLNDLSALSTMSMPSLTTLNFSENNITDISFLSSMNLPLLSLLQFNLNSVSDLSPIGDLVDNSGCTISSLWIGTQSETTPVVTSDYIVNQDNTVSFLSPFVLVDGSYSNGVDATLYSNLATHSATMDLVTGYITVPISKIEQKMTLTLTGTKNVGDGLTSITAFTGSVDVTLLSKSYEIDFASVTGGTVTGQSVANVGEVVSLTINEEHGYTYDRVTIDGVNDITVVGNTITFTMPEQAIEVVPVFNANTYSITIQNSDGITFDSITSAKYNSNVLIPYTVTAGYLLDSIEITNNLDYTNNLVNLSFTMPANDIVITPTTSKELYTVTVYDDQNQPIDTLYKYHGDAVIITTTPDSGYKLSSVSIPGLTEFTIDQNDIYFTMPMQSVNVTPQFDYIGYAIYEGTVSEGSLSINQDYYLPNTEVSIAVVCNDGFILDDVTIANVSDVRVVDNVILFTMPEQDVYIDVTFELIPDFEYTITVETINGITPTVSTDIALTDDVITISHVGDVIGHYEVDGYFIEYNDTVVSLELGETLIMPSANVVIKPSFKEVIVYYSIHLENQDERLGTLSLDKTEVALHEQFNVTVQPAAGYTFDSLVETYVELDIENTISSLVEGVYQTELAYQNDVTYQCNFKAIQYIPEDTVFTGDHTISVVTLLNCFFVATMFILLITTTNKENT